MSAPVRNYNKAFGIGGFIVGEIIMLFTVLAPNTQGKPAARADAAILRVLPEKEVDVPRFRPPPADLSVMRVLVGSIFFGPFGAAAGTGVGMLVSGLVGNFRRDERVERGTEPS